MIDFQTFVAEADRTERVARVLRSMVETLTAESCPRRPCGDCEFEACSLRNRLLPLQFDLAKKDV